MTYEKVLTNNVWVITSGAHLPDESKATFDAVLIQSPRHYEIKMVTVSAFQIVLRVTR